MDNTLYINNASNIIRRRNQITLVVGEHQIYNPAEKLLLENGWSIYTPPTPLTIEPTKEDKYKQRVIDLVRERYSIDDELAIQRQRDIKVEEFNTYNDFVESCKETAYNEIYGEDTL